MSLDSRSRRFDPRRLFPAIETDWDETSDGPDASPFSPDEDPANVPAGQDFDEELRQIASDGCCTCPHCGAIVSSDGSAVN